MLIIGPLTFLIKTVDLGYMLRSGQGNQLDNGNGLKGDSLEIGTPLQF